jgi:phage tail sheath protein FI
MSATQTSAWSGAIAVKILETEPGAGPSSAAGAAIREIQKALIRLCAAQGELFSVLSLPRTMNEQDAANHVLTLSAAPADDASANNARFDPEGRTGSYAAIYHPWIEARCTSGSVRPLPPDGAILGMIAARTRSRGAWIAPANQTLRSVVALHTELPATRQAVLFDAGINVVLHRPEGYTLMSEDTLSGIPDQRPMHVRRLLILLRRMMLRVGEEFTFETNGDALRALIRQRCNNMLERLFRAGAFAGRSAAESFQVSVDDADNTLASVDAGRLIVRIRVRPAQALRFITLRFSLGGGATGVSEENAA